MMPWIAAQHTTCLEFPLSEAWLDGGEELPEVIVPS